MDIMYIKYKGNKRQTIIKNKSNILKTNTILSNNNSKILTTPAKILNLNTYKADKEQQLNDEISNYFFEQIHKNYLKNK
ncbi:MAG: hypothetical protein E7207_00935 [Clostridium butyricum]|nr:hypothetical protein [Clostridium butyricum]